METPLLDLVLSSLATPELYFGAGAGALLTKLGRLFVIIASVITIFTAIGKLIGSFPKIAGALMLSVTLLVALPGCSSIPENVPVNSGEVYKPTNVVLGSSFCMTEKDAMLDLIRQRRACSTVVSGTICDDGSIILRQAKLNYKNCVKHYADTNVIFNPFNIYRSR